MRVLCGVGCGGGCAAHLAESGALMSFGDVVVVALFFTVFVMAVSGFVSRGH